MGASGESARGYQIARRGLAVGVKRVMKPYITIGIPTFNREGYLRECIESCFAQQTLQSIPYQIVVSNNNSTDGTAAYLDGLMRPVPSQASLTVIHQPVGVLPVLNWQVCLDAAEGEYFILLSDDDCLEPGFIETVTRHLESAIYSPAGVITGFHDTDAQGRVTRTYHNLPGVVEGGEFLRQLVTRKQRYRWSAFLAKTAVLKDSRVFAQPFPGSGMFADGAAMIACCASGPILRIEKPLIRYRLHQGNDSKRPDLEANRTGREILIGFSEQFETGIGGVTALVRYWCADGYLYQLAQWIMRRKLTTIELSDSLWQIKCIATAIRWPILPLSARIGFRIRYGLIWSFSTVQGCFARLIKKHA